MGRGCSDKGKGKMFKEPVFEDHCETFKSKGKVRDKRDIFSLRFVTILNSCIFRQRTIATAPTICAMNYQLLPRHQIFMEIKYFLL